MIYYIDVHKFSIYFVLHFIFIEFNLLWNTYTIINYITIIIMFFFIIYNCTYYNILSNIIVND